MKTSTISRTLAVTATTATLAVSGLAASATPALAQSGDDRVIRTGACSSGGTWKLKVKTDDGRLEVEGEVDTNRSGQSWAWTISQNGSVASRGSATTRGRSGSFSVERKISDPAGADRIVFRATRDGNVCRGSITF